MLLKFWQWLQQSSTSDLFLSVTSLNKIQISSPCPYLLIMPPPLPLIPLPPIILAIAARMSILIP